MAAMAGFHLAGHVLNCNNIVEINSALRTKKNINCCLSKLPELLTQQNCVMCLWGAMSVVTVGVNVLC